MKTYKVLPNVNNLDFCGRVVADPFVTKNGNVMFLKLIRNFGGDKPAVTMEFVMFKPKEGFPEFLKKGAPVVAHAYITPVSYTDKNGKEVENVQYVIKKVELAELVERKVKDSAPEVSDAAGEESIEPAE